MNTRDKQIIRKILEEIIVTEAMIESYDLDKFLSDELAKRVACMTLMIYDYFWSGRVVSFRRPDFF